MVEITIVEIEEDVPFQENLLFFVSEHRKNRIIRYKNEPDKKRSLLAELQLEETSTGSLTSRI